MASPSQSQQQRTSRSARRSSSYRRARSQSPPASLTTEPAFPKPVVPRRAVSYPADSTSLQRHRLRIQYGDEALRLRSLENVVQLMQTVATTELKSGPQSSLTNSEIIARKALMYRKVLDRMNDVDVYDPTFDASAFLGVEWCKRSARAPVAQRIYARSA